MAADLFARPGHRALRRGRASVPDQVYLVTFVTRARKPIFADAASATTVAEVLRSPATWAPCEALAWVLMPDHVHVLLRLDPGTGLSAVVKRAKAMTAIAHSRRVSRFGSVWAAAFHDHALRTEEDLRAAARHLVANPVRAGLVQRPGDYPFWGALWTGEDW
jgi:REP element-mobilizing transposase RayT